MDIKTFLNKRPLCFLATTSGARDVALGAGYLAENSYIRGTLLWQHYDALWPGYSAGIVGVTFVMVGLGTAFFAVRNKTKWTRRMLFTSAMLWLFATLMYFLNGEWALGLYLGLYMSITSGYISYFYKFSPVWRTQRQVFRDRFIEEHDPFKDR